MEQALSGAAPCPRAKGAQLPTKGLPVVRKVAQIMVEPTGIEPVTSTLPVLRSPS